MKKNKKIKITQIKSSIGCLKKHKLTLHGLGLRKIGHYVYRKKTKSIMGMINLVNYMVKIGK